MCCLTDKLMFSAVCTRATFCNKLKFFPQLHFNLFCRIPMTFQEYSAAFRHLRWIIKEKQLRHQLRTAYIIPPLLSSRENIQQSFLFWILNKHELISETIHVDYSGYMRRKGAIIKLQSGKASLSTQTTSPKIVKCLFIVALFPTRVEVCFGWTSIFVQSHFLQFLVSRNFHEIPE